LCIEVEDSTTEEMLSRYQAGLGSHRCSCQTRPDFADESAVQSADDGLCGTQKIVLLDLRYPRRSFSFGLRLRLELGLGISPRAFGRCRVALRH
jgi:hypothetical protein